MAKKDNPVLYVLLFVGALIAWPFVWLYQTVGQAWFLIIVVGFPLAGLAAYVIRHRRLNAQAAAERLRYQKEEELLRQAGWLFDDVFSLYLFSKIESVRTEADLNWAREQLQLIAYSLVGKNVPQAQKDHFTAFMKRFALIDPLYYRILDKVLPVIQDNPGVIQSTLYKDRPPKEKELVRYVLYFAHELGHIYRKKKGNSYLLFPSQDSQCKISQ